MIIQILIGLVLAVIVVVFIITPIILIYFALKNRKIKKKYRKLLELENENKNK